MNRGYGAKRASWIHPATSSAFIMRASIDSRPLGVSEPDQESRREKIHSRRQPRCVRRIAGRLAAWVRRTPSRGGASQLETRGIVKWGHLVYLSNGPVLLIRSEAHRVLFGFWRGQRLRAIEERLKPGGKYEMATLELHENTTVTSAVVRRLTREAVALNAALGNPAQANK